MKVIWLKRAIRQRENQEEWYRSTKGLDFAKTFIRNLYRAELQIRAMPDIGQKEKSTRDGKSVRSVLADVQALSEVNLEPTGGIVFFCHPPRTVGTIDGKGGIEVFCALTAPVVEVANLLRCQRTRSGDVGHTQFFIIHFSFFTSNRTYAVKRHLNLTDGTVVVEFQAVNVGLAVGAVAPEL